ncbi:MAG: FAD:protein FMN transferase [Verrucomicrobiota bacterium]
MMSESEPLLYQFNGMNTTFSIRLRGADPAGVESSIHTCCELLETLESLLSRYRHDSDISRINHMQTGDELLIDPKTHECLKRALQACEATQGLFDATLGQQVTHRKDNQTGKAPSPAGQLKITDDRPMVQCLAAGRQIDLGGIGKGYALDQWAQVLKPLQLESVLLSAGTSTHLAFGDYAWPIEMIHDQEEGRNSYSLGSEGFSVSGVQMQGNHLVHPDEPDEIGLPLKQVWVAHPSATYADAFSTACLLMQPEELHDFFVSQPDLTFLQAEPACGQGLITCSDTAR